MRRKRCPAAWPGACGTPWCYQCGKCRHGPAHACVRPLGHEPPCMCACGARVELELVDSLWRHCRGCGALPGEECRPLSTHHGSHGNGVSAPGRRQEDDINLVAFANQHRVETGPIAQPLTGSLGQPGGVAAGALVRRLTPLECERLQGFPDGWTEGFSDSARYRMLGNAVAVPCVEWIARRIAQVAS